MNSNIISVIIAGCFLAIKLLARKFSKQQNNVSVKSILKDTLFVFISTMAGFFIYSQIEPLSSSVSSSIPNVFTSEPDF